MKEEIKAFLYSHLRVWILKQFTHYCPFFSKLQRTVGSSWMYGWQMRCKLHTNYQSSRKKTRQTFRVYLDKISGIALTLFLAIEARNLTIRSLTISEYKISETNEGWNMPFFIQAHWKMWNNLSKGKTGNMKLASV